MISKASEQIDGDTDYASLLTSFLENEMHIITYSNVLQLGRAIVLCLGFWTYPQWWSGPSLSERTKEYVVCSKEGCSSNFCCHQTVLQLKLLCCSHFNVLSLMPMLWVPVYCYSYWWQLFRCCLHYIQETSYFIWQAAFLHDSLGEGDSGLSLHSSRGGGKKTQCIVK